MAERQLSWYRYSENHPEMHTYNLLLINTPREISIIKQKLRERLKSVVEEVVIDSGNIQGSGGLHYDLFYIVSNVLDIDFSKVYEGKISRDRRLHPRRTRSGWDDLTSKLASGEF